MKYKKLKFFFYDRLINLRYKFFVLSYQSYNDMFSRFVRNTITLLIDCKLIKPIIAINAINTFLSIIISLALCFISSKRFGSIAMIIFVTSDLIDSFLSTIVVDYYNSKVSRLISIKFNQKALERYNSLSFESKNKATAEKFYQKMDQASSAIGHLIEWGLPTALQLVNMFIQCIIIFCFQKMVLYLSIIILINVMSYILFLNKKQTNFSKQLVSTREECDCTTDIIKLNLPAFQCKEKSVHFVHNLTTININRWEAVEFLFKQTMMITNLINKISVILICFGMRNSIQNFYLSLRTLGNMTSSIKQLSCFLNQYNRYETNFESYEKFFNKLSSTADPTHLPFPQTLTLTKVDVHVGGLNIKLDESLSNFNISKGEKIIIVGKTGHGKTTFVNALMGKIKGISFGHCQGAPENYHHAYVEMYQNIREKLPTSNITIRNLFDDESSDQLINECLAPCFPTEDLTRLLNNLLTDNEESSEELKSTIIKMSNTNPFDVAIKERISGGEKTRIALATRVYQMRKHPEKEVFILDEPEQGVDRQVAFIVIQNIFNMFNSKIIIMITHMCSCQIEMLNIIWKYRLRIENGIVHQF